MALSFMLSFSLKSFGNISNYSTVSCNEFDWFHQPENQRDCWKQSLCTKCLTKSSGLKVGGLKSLGFSKFFAKMYKFLTAIWMRTANFGPLSWEQPHTPSVNHCLYIFGSRVTGSHVVGLGPYAWQSVSWDRNREPSHSYYNALTH